MVGVEVRVLAGLVESGIVAQHENDEFRAAAYHARDAPTQTGRADITECEVWGVGGVSLE